MYNLRADGNVEIRDEAEVSAMRVREVTDSDERARLWAAAVAAFPPYEEYQDRTSRTIPGVRGRARVTLPLKRLAKWSDSWFECLMYRAF